MGYPTHAALHRHGRGPRRPRLYVLFHSLVRRIRLVEHTPPRPSNKNDFLLLATSCRQILSSDVKSTGRKTDIDRVVFDACLLDEVFSPSRSALFCYTVKIAKIA